MAAALLYAAGHPLVTGMGCVEQLRSQRENKKIIGLGDFRDFCNIRFKVSHAAVQELGF